HSLIRAIIHQQLSGTAAGTIQRRFQQLFPENELPSPEQGLATPPETLRSAGLSRAKLAYILDLAQKVIEGVVPSLEEIDRLTDDEIVARVTQIRGCGRG